MEQKYVGERVERDGGRTSAKQMNGVTGMYNVGNVSAVGGADETSR
jgi:hypothetical protein